MPEMILMETEERMEKSIESYRHELATVRTGRANPALLDTISIEYYGVMTPLRQVANVSAPEASQLLIKPFDRSTVKAIEAAINASDLGLTPQSDGTQIRLNIPKMTEERRRELTKLVNKMSEGAKIAIRNIRRDGNDAIKKCDSLTEDEEKRYLDDIQKLTDKFIEVVEKMTSEKEKDLMTI